MDFPPVPSPRVKSPPWSMTRERAMARVRNATRRIKKEVENQLTVGDNSVERRSRVSESVLSSGQLSEVTLDSTRKQDQ